LRFGFLICILENEGVFNFCDFGGQGCPHNFGDFILVGRDSVSLMISNVNKITKPKLYLIYIDDSSMIFVFPLHIFPVNNFSVKLFSDNN
jgi:hypothetical protein